MAFFCCHHFYTPALLNVLAIAPYAFLPPQMGGQKYIEIFYRYLGAEVNTIVASTQNNDEIFAKNYTLQKVFSNSKYRYGNAANFLRLKRIIRQYNITHVILEHPYMGWLGVLLQRTTGIKLVIHSHNIEGERFKSLHKPWWKLLWHYEEWVHQRADYSFFITEADKQYAIQNFQLKSEKCYTAFYGIETNYAPTEAQKRAAKENICTQLQLPITTHLLLFNGNFFYQPNRDGLLHLLNTVVPLLNKNNYNFKLIVCGKGIDNAIKMLQPDNVLLLDFVPDISIYNLAADVFLNPVIEGGGVKTKLVEALAANTQVVSTRSGATGVRQEWCGGKLTIVEDNDWIAFCKAITNNNTAEAPVANIFFEQFYMGNIARQIVTTLVSENL